MGVDPYEALRVKQVPDLAAAVAGRDLSKAWAWLTVNEPPASI